MFYCNFLSLNLSLIWALPQNGDATDTILNKDLSKQMDDRYDLVHYVNDYISITLPFYRGNIVVLYFCSKVVVFELIAF